MREPETPPASPKGPVTQASPARTAPLNVASPQGDKMICERCGVAEMYRMHAVWRCPACGFKTDCCGW
jgi:ribosomal protein L37AE/L43A